MRRQRQRDRPLTAAEIHALHFICRQHGVELVELLRSHGIAQHVEALTARQVDKVLYLLQSRSQPEPRNREEEACPEES